jgi:multiple sugar transport system permease protein
MRGVAVRKAGIYTCLLLFALVGTLPFLWALMTSLKTPADAFSMPPVLIFRPTVTPYVQLLRDGLFGDYLVNSLIVTAWVVAISVVIGCFGGYALARFSGISSLMLLSAGLVLYALPRVAVLLPFYEGAQRSGLFDTKLLLILVMVAVNQPFTLWLFESFFREIPQQVEQAAMIDGCTRLQAFRYVVVPILGPGLATTSIFSALFAYNEFLLPVILGGPDSATMPVLIANYAGTSDVRQWPLFAAAAVTVALPLVLLVILCQKYIVRGLLSGAVKG